MNSQNFERPPFPHEPQRPARSPDQTGIDSAALITGLRRRKWLILTCIALTMMVAIIGLSKTRPSYASYVEVLLNTRQERVVGVEQVVSDLNVTNSVVAGEIAVLRSNLLLGQVVDDLGLMEHPDFNPYTTNRPGFIARLVDMGWAGLANLDLFSEGPEPMPSVDEEGGLSREDARNIVIWQVRQNLVAYQSGISYVISISVRAHDPEIAAAIANAVAENYINDQLETKLVATQRAITWLDQRLIELEVQLRSAEDAVVEFLARQVLEEGGDKASVSQQLTEMNRAIVSARDERATAAVRLSNVRHLMAEDGLEGAAAALSTPRLLSLDAELADLERQRAQLATRLGSRHPEMLALQLALDDLSRDRAAAIRAGIRGLQAALIQAEGREKSIIADIDRAQSQQVELSRSSVRLSQLERSASAMRQVYESFLARFQETTQQLEFQRPDARIITVGEPALVPSYPRTKLILAVALVLGAILGLAAALVSAALDRSLRTTADVLDRIDIPALAVLPLMKRRRRGDWQRIELESADVSPYAEGLRMLRFGLMKPQEGRPQRVIMLTSTGVGQGCSTAVLGLARSVAALGESVVILDANFRDPMQADLLGVTPHGSGIADFVQGTTTAEDITLVDVEPGLSLVPACPNTGNGADTLSSPRFRTLLAELLETYHTVIIDAPPAIGSADATVLAGQADAIVLVVRSGKAKAAKVLAAVDALRDAGGRVVGALLSHATEDITRPVAVPHRASPALQMEH